LQIISWKYKPSGDWFLSALIVRVSEMNITIGILSNNIL
jgi:hypothetical protein